MKKNIDIKVRTDRQLAWHRGGSVRYLVVDLIGKETENERSDERQPLNLALVIDRSGSMHGRPIEAAKEAATGVIEMLTEKDLLTVVCFDNTVNTIVRSLPMEKSGRKEARQNIEPIQPGGTTDLEAGWLRGAECVAENMQGNTTYRNHIVLLSDGMANEGETSPEILGEYAGGLQARGIISSTVGIGDNYSPEILQAIAENGGGRMHDAEHPREIVEVVTAELGEISKVIADNLRLDIQVPIDSTIKIVSSISLHTEGDNGYSCLLGNLAARRSRQVVFQVDLPNGRQGDELYFQFTASWLYEGKTDACDTHTVIQLVHGKENNAQQRDIDASLTVAAVWQAQLVRKVTEINSRRDYQELKNLQANEFHYFQKYCRELPNGMEMISRVERLLVRARRPLHERSRKEMTLAAYKMQSCEADFRSSKRASWDSYIDD